MASSDASVLVTGANGNLGRKLVAHLAADARFSRVVALDLAPADASSDRVLPVAVDLSRPSPALDAAFVEVDAVVHLAARNPYPNADWEDGAVSFDMTLNAIEAARRGGARRFVFASSNHVMGGYKDVEPSLAPGALTPHLPPRPGTRTVDVDVPRAYAAAKLMGERALAARAAMDGMTAVSLRIGWCQPGPNHPSTISAAGVPDTSSPATADRARNLLWFRSMWLSNGDFLRAVVAALTADAAAWPAPAIVVNAMSDNAGMPWDLAPTRALIGYAPRDDAWRHLEPAP